MEYGTGSFPTMGISAAQLSRVTPPSAGKLRPRGHGGKSAEPAQATKGVRGQVYGRMGATLHPTTRIYEQNSPEASQTLRRVVQMQSASSWTDNWRSAARSLSG